MNPKTSRGHEKRAYSLVIPSTGKWRKTNGGAKKKKKSNSITTCTFVDEKKSNFSPPPHHPNQPLSLKNEVNNMWYGNGISALCMLVVVCICIPSFLNPPLPSVAALPFGDGKENTNKIMTSFNRYFFIMYFIY